MISQITKTLWTTIARTVVIAAVILVAFFAYAKDPAGIVLYYSDGESVFLLLADHAKSTRGWSAFGGSANLGETRWGTAARETHEETRGYFLREWLGQQIAEQEPVLSHGYSMFFVEVPFVPAQRVMNNPINKSDKSMLERQYYTWIPFSELERVLVKEDPSTEDLKVNPLYLPRGSQSDSYWDVWIRNMHDAMKQRAFPWIKNRSKTERDVGEATSESSLSEISETSRR
jgi:8-oxo-dGTP pyrophosphatase MutT (NUDIX family)